MVVLLRSRPARPPSTPWPLPRRRRRRVMTRRRYTHCRASSLPNGSNSRHRPSAPAHGRNPPSTLRRPPPPRRARRAAMPESSCQPAVRRRGVNVARSTSAAAPTAHFASSHGSTSTATPLEWREDLRPQRAIEVRSHVQPRLRAFAADEHELRAQDVHEAGDRAAERRTRRGDRSAALRHRRRRRAHAASRCPGARRDHVLPPRLGDECRDRRRRPRGSRACRRSSAGRRRPPTRARTRPRRRRTRGRCRRRRRSRGRRRVRS